MIFSGADLIRTSGQHADQSRKLQVSTAVAAVAATDSSSSSAQQDTNKSAFLRFARFVREEAGKGKRALHKLAAKKLPEGYLKQIRMFTEEPAEELPRLDIYA